MNPTLFHSYEAEHSNEENCMRGGHCAFARILLGNGIRKCEIYSILCTTREAELRFRFSYLQLLGFYSNPSELAFNQWGRRFESYTAHPIKSITCERSEMAAFSSSAFIPIFRRINGKGVAIYIGMR